MIDDIFQNFGEWSEHGFSQVEIPISDDIDSFNNLEVTSPSEILSSEQFSDIENDVSEVGEHNSQQEDRFADHDDSSISTLSLELPEQQWHTDEFDGLGDPMNDARFWRSQTGKSSCAVVAQASVLESMTGIHVSEENACLIAEQNGWFNPEIGTYPDGMGKLLNEFGITTTQQYDASLEDIADAIEEGKEALVALDANEIWYPLRDSNGLPIEQTNAGHAVWVTGIDTQADGSVKIILNDSGHSNGKMVEVDALDFLNAWQDHSNFLVVANSPEKTAIA